MRRLFRLQSIVSYIWSPPITSILLLILLLLVLPLLLQNDPLCQAKNMSLIKKSGVQWILVRKVADQTAPSHYQVSILDVLVDTKQLLPFASIDICLQIEC